MQAPKNRSDFWFMVAQGLSGLILVAGGWIISALVTEVDSLAEKVSEIDAHQTEERLRLEMALKGELADLRTDLTILKAQEE